MEVGRLLSLHQAQQRVMLAQHARHILLRVASPPIRLGWAWGNCWVTPRRAAASQEVIGYQMMCTRPCHNLSGRCTKELHFRSGKVTEDVVMRRLMAWVVFGAGSPDQRSHRVDAFGLIMQLEEDCGLPSFVDLDFEKITDWEAFNRQLTPAVELPSASPAAHAELGEAAPGCPDEIHQEMRRLAALGALPLTTLEQRMRQRLSSGTTYGVPPGLRPALHWVYLNPNLPNPTNMCWKCKGKTWLLVLKGG